MDQNPHFAATAIQQRRDDSLVGQEVMVGIRLEQRLGEGAFGAVYRATDRVLDRPLAVKLLHPHIAIQQPLVERFFREARILARLTGNPHIPVIFHVGWFGQQPYMVMEFVQGRDLQGSISQLADRRARPSRTFVLDVLMQVAVALADTHQHGIIHRDLKPANVILVEQRLFINGLIKVLDFGVAHSSDILTGGNATAAGTLIGTPPYMAPELFSGGHASVASDLYAMGVLAFALASAGRLPIEADNLMDFVRAHIEGRRQRFIDVQPDHGWPAEFLELLDRLLAPDPAHRPEGAHHVLSALKFIDDAITAKKR